MNSGFDPLVFRQASVRLYGHMFAPLLSRWTLTQAELEVLLFLANNPEYDTASAIVSQRGLAKSQISTSVDALEQRGFLLREVDPSNRKIQHLRLLPAAELVVSEGQACRHAFAEALFAGIGPAQRELLEQTLIQLTRNAQQALEALRRQEQGSSQDSLR